jgi:rhodanese-related sulfurtransferase
MGAGGLGEAGERPEEPAARQVPATIEQLLESARARYRRLDPAAAASALEAGALLVDTRCTEHRRASGTIAGSVHVPLSVLYWRLDPASEFRNPELADREREVVLLCAHGYSSSLAVATLLDLGYDRATDVAGGFEAWVAAGLPIVEVSRAGTAP